MRIFHTTLHVPGYFKNLSYGHPRVPNETDDLSRKAYFSQRTQHVLCYQRFILSNLFFITHSNHSNHTRVLNAIPLKTNLNIIISRELINIGRSDRYQHMRQQNFLFQACKHCTLGVHSHSVPAPSPSYKSKQPERKWKKVFATAKFAEFLAGQYGHRNRSPAITVVTYIISIKRQMDIVRQIC